MVQGTFSVHSKWQERLKSLRVTFFRKYFYVLLLYLQQSFGISEPETHFPSRVFMNILSQCVQCLMQSMNYCELSLCIEYVRQTSAAFLFNIVRNGDGIDLCCSLFTMEKNIWTFEYTHLHQGKFSLNIRKMWNSLPRAVVMKLSCQSLRRIWTTLQKYVWFLGGSMRSQDLNLMILVGPLQLIVFYDSVIHMVKGFLIFFYLESEANRFFISPLNKWI